MRKTFLLTFILLILSLHYAYSEDKGLREISSIKLNSLTVDNNAELNHLRFIVKAGKAGNFEPIIDIKNATQKSLEYFFVGLAMPDEKFWVNLNPKEPQRIVDPVLGDTDLGRIMLNADLRLKEDICALTNPETSSIGKEFWKRLYEKADQLGIIDKIPVMTRLWIVPDEVIVYETENQITIISNRLKVCLESAYLSQEIEIKDGRQRQLQDYASNLMEELVSPLLNQKVNESYSYSDLREVYCALILARWYKQKFNHQPNSLLKMVDLQVLQDSSMGFFYNSGQIYQDYLKSLKQGEYAFSETDIEGAYFYPIRTIRHYFSGGVDFTKTRLIRLNSPARTQSEENNALVVCNLFIPQGIQRPLQYAKNQLELSVDNSAQHQNMPVILAKDLPAITPLRFAEASIRDLNYAYKTNRLILSKL